MRIYDSPYPHIGMVVSEPNRQQMILQPIEQAAPHGVCCMPSCTWAATGTHRKSGRPYCTGHMPNKLAWPYPARM